MLCDYLTQGALFITVAYFSQDSHARMRFSFHMWVRGTRDLNGSKLSYFGQDEVEFGVWGFKGLGGGGRCVLMSC